ncbi:MAG: phospho-sugar mutase [Clostridia bacterium]|nr:phospho-sugar mutase [Clostridia bacterium]
MEYLEKYNKWCNNTVFDEESRKELLDLKGNDEEIKDRFYKDLEFGTAGLRGIIGMGSNRMNKYTVGKATQGLANYIIKQNGQERGVAIAYDSRRMSKEFSNIAALCLNANGIKTYIFDDIRPTPELSFAVRELGCIAGIVITASHNPPEYNGYKVYWEDGAQIIDNTADGIIEEVNNITDFSLIKNVKLEEAKEKELYNIISTSIDDKYINELKKLVLNKNSIQNESEKIKIVYTPLHGTGNKLVQRLLNELGFKNVYIVKEQEKPDGNFPTVSYPNPEDPKAFELALNLAKEKDADVVLATDPDSDRLGVFAKDNKTGDYIRFTGNMSGNLILEYLLSQRKEKEILPKNTAVIKTIVSSNLTDSIVNEYNVKLFETLTGFKNIAKIIRGFDETKEYETLFSYEESYGCIIGTHARDKDGIVAVMALCEAAAYYKDNGMTLVDQMNNIYKKYGYFEDEQISITLKGQEGAIKIKKMMEDLRNNPPKQIGNNKILKIKDILLGEEKYLPANVTNKISLDKSNVLYYEFVDESWCAVRPSGTEPKIKFYIGVKGNTKEEAKEKMENLKKGINELI